MIYLGFKSIKIFQDFEDFIEIPPSKFSVFSKTTDLEDYFGPTKSSFAMLFNVCVPRYFRKNQNFGFSKGWDMQKQ